MNKDKYVFAQLVAFSTTTSSVTWLDKYDGNRYVRTSPAFRNQLMALMFDNSVTVRACVMLSLHGDSPNPNVITLEWGCNPIAKNDICHSESES